MTSLLKNVDLRTQLAGSNRMELLTFCMNGSQKYGINVFKVREVMFCPELSPVKDEFLRGIVYLRGRSLSVIDLNRVVHDENAVDDNALLIVTEFADSLQGFLVRSVDRILNLEWREIHPPPSSLAVDSFVTATTQHDSELIQLLDVERVLDTISPIEVKVSSNDVEKLRTLTECFGTLDVIYADDSAVAKQNIEKILQQLGVNPIGFSDGLSALKYIRKRAATVGGKSDLACVISDIEMPKMDGFTLVQTMKREDKMRSIKVFLHSSLSGDVNKDKAIQVGADGFINKKAPDELARAIRLSITHLMRKQG